jgi:hypothetical protein
MIGKQSNETARQPINAFTEKIMEKYTIERLNSMADSIVIGEVTKIQPSRWNTPDGKKPISIRNTSHIIYTDVLIRVEKYLKNPLITDRIIIRVLGGTVGEESLIVEDQPSFKSNEKVLIFFKSDHDPRTKNIGMKHFVIAGNFQGKTTIENGKVIIGGEKLTVDELLAKFSKKVDKTKVEEIKEGE